MNKDRSEAMFAHIDSYPKVMGTVLKRMWQVWRSPPTYRPCDHYMRGPGPKWREKHVRDRTASGVVQRPMALGD